MNIEYIRTMEYPNEYIDTDAIDNKLFQDQIDFETRQNKIITRAKISDKLKELHNLQPDHNKIFNISRMFYNLSCTDLKFKLLQDNSMYDIINLLPNGGCHEIFSCFHDIRFNGNFMGRILNIDISMKFIHEMDFFNDFRFVLNIDSNYNFDETKFNPNTLFDEITFQINNTIIEKIHFNMITWNMAKNKQSWTYELNKLVIPIPLDILNPSSGIFMNKINPKSKLRLIVKTSSKSEILDNTKEIKCCCSNYVYSYTSEKINHKKMPTKYNLDLFNLLSFDPMLSSYEITSLNSVFASNYMELQYLGPNIFRTHEINRFSLHLYNYVKGICWVIFDDNKNIITDPIFEKIFTQINGCDHISLDLAMLKYSMKNNKDFQIPLGYYYVNFEYFLNMSLTDNFIIGFRPNLKNIEENKIYSIDIWANTGNTLLYMDGLVQKIN